MASGRTPTPDYGRGGTHGGIDGMHLLVSFERWFDRFVSLRRRAGWAMPSIYCDTLYAFYSTAKRPDRRSCIDE